MADPSVPDRPRRGTPRWVWLIPIAVVALPVVLRMFVLEAFKIPSGAMMPTLEIGDHIFVQKLGGAGARGDVIVFEFPENRAQAFVKRVIALPGEQVEYLDGRPIVNGAMLPRCAVGTIERDRPYQLEVAVSGGAPHLAMYERALDDRPCATDAECGAGVCRGARCGENAEGPWVVAPGQLWVNGDNRNNSHDSRSWSAGRGAGVPVDHVKGKASLYWLRGRSGDPNLKAVHGARLGDGDAALRPALAACSKTLGV